MSTVEMRTASSAGADLAPLHKPNKRWTRFILPGFTWLMILYLTLPIFMMILYSFNDIPVVGSPRQTPKFWGFTTHWWRDLFGIAGLSDAPEPRSSSRRCPRSRRRSSERWSASRSVATASEEGAGQLRDLPCDRRPRDRPRVVPAVDVHPGANAADRVHDHPALAHRVQHRIRGRDGASAGPGPGPVAEDAAQDLFANPITTFFRVTPPLIAPAILAGFLLAFVLSLDDFVITNFTSGSVQTFPVWVFGATRIGLPPQANVMGTLLFGAGLLFAVGNVIVQRRRARS